MRYTITDETIKAAGKEILAMLNAETKRAEEAHGRAQRAELMLEKIAKHPDTPELIRQYAKGMLDAL